jgi:hypothetical protein
MTELFILMGFIWVIGWCISCGVHNENCDTLGVKSDYLSYLGLFIFWPEFLGRYIPKGK